MFIICFWLFKNGICYLLVKSFGLINYCFIGYYIDIYGFEGLFEGIEIKFVFIGGLIIDMLKYLGLVSI